MKHVTRYVATYINSDGMRTLMGAAQGRNTYETAEEAQHWIDAVLANNPTSTVESIWGNVTAASFAVRPCLCYPGHFDPVVVWFD